MPADILRLDCHSRTTTFSTLFVLLRNDREGLLVTRTPTPRRAARGAVRAQSMRYQPILLTLFPPFVFFIKNTAVIKGGWRLRTIQK